ncbi:MAG: hypothetical protein AAF702_17125 [Chloroflexota bacterium]
MVNHYPTLEEFLVAPIEDIRKIAPETLILTNDGTRRRAALEGIDPASDEYAQWSRLQMIDSLAMLFYHGIRHIFTIVVGETNYAESTPRYREKLSKWVEWGLTGEDALRDYAARNWRVRLIGTDSWPELQSTSRRLEAETAQNDGPRVWFFAASHAETNWEYIFRTLKGSDITTRQEAIRAMYGEDVPLATMFLGTGKPEIFPSIVPPLLVGKLQCYWRMHLGYMVDEQLLRSILYDYAYTRNTWQQDKTGRAEKVLEFKAVWQDPDVIGLGFRLGPFWYPTTRSELLNSEKPE